MNNKIKKKNNSSRTDQKKKHKNPQMLGMIAAKKRESEISESHNFMRNNWHVSRSHVIIVFLAKTGPILVCVSSAEWPL